MSTLPMRPKDLALALLVIGVWGVNFAVIKIGIVGVPPPGTAMPGDLGTVLTFGQTVRGIIEGDSDPDAFIPVLIDHWRAGRLPLEKLVRTYPFAQINEAIDAQHHGDCVKVVLVTDTATS